MARISLSLVLALIFCSEAGLGLKDVFSSTHEMEQLLRREVEFSREMFQYAEELRARLKWVEDYLGKAYPNGPLEVSDPEEYVSNPLNGLGILRRVSFLPRYTALAHELAHDLLSNTTSSLSVKMNSFPVMQEYKDAVNSISLLREAYDLNVTELSVGKIVSSPPNPQVYFSDYIPIWTELGELGTYSCNRGWWDTGLTWIQLALDRYPGGDEAMLAYYQKQLRVGKQMHDHFLDKRGPIGINHRCFPVPFDEKLRKKKKYKKARNKKVEKPSKFVPLFSKIEKIAELEDNFHSICKDGSDKWRSPEMEKDFKCRYVHHSNPFLKLGPFKLEEKSDYPLIVMFHDFFFDHEIKYLKDTASPTLERSVTGHAKEVKRTFSRTSKQAWITDRWFNISGSEVSHADYDNKTMDPPPVPSDVMKYIRVKDEVVYKLSLRIQNATEMIVLGPFSSEAYQVANYGMVGQYSSHLDPQGYFDGQVKNTEQKRLNIAVGDRLATFMGYLSSVDLGGRTVFPLAGLYSKVEKGAGIFWINLYSDGHRDENTYHGGCPVLIGSKWITNKWIFSNDQFHNYPCSLKPKENYHLLQSWRKSHTY